MGGAFNGWQESRRLLCALDYNQTLSSTPTFFFFRYPPISFSLQSIVIQFRKMKGSNRVRCSDDLQSGSHRQKRFVGTLLVG